MNCTVHVYFNVYCVSYSLCIFVVNALLHKNLLDPYQSSYNSSLSMWLWTWSRKLSMSNTDKIPETINSQPLGTISWTINSKHWARSQKLSMPNHWAQSQRLSMQNTGHDVINFQFPTTGYDLKNYQCQTKGTIL